tara:strand:- start:461 stop:1228 length:768 start_codon:yes stop_codon:yes gene_type:complete
MYKILLLMISILFCQTDKFEEGKAYYNNRSEGANGLIPKIDNISKAIKIFESLQEPYNTSDADLNASIYLVKSYYFMAQYVAKGNDDKLLYFELAKDLSERYIYKYPESVELLYWNLATISNWAKLLGVRQISQLGAADNYRDKAVDVIVMDSNYEDGGGYFLLGAVYFTAPYIPLMISWPDDNKAVKYFKRAIETGRATPLQLIYLAKALIETDELDEARNVLKQVMNTTPSEMNYIEDSNYITEAKNIWDENF